MIRCANGIRVLIITTIISLFGMTSMGLSQDEEHDTSEEWREGARFFNEGLNDWLAPEIDPKNGAAKLIEVMKAIRASKELEDLAMAYDKLLVIDADDRMNEEDALRSDIARRRLKLTEESMARVRAVLDAEYFDFGIDRSAGTATILPHLSPMRNIARLLALRAKILIRENNWQEAKLVVVDMLRLSMVARNDRTTISALVGASIGAMGLSILEEAMTEQRLDAASAMPFRMATMHSEKDPYGFREAILGEYEMMKESAQYIGDDEKIELLAELGENREERMYLASLSLEGYLEELEEMRQACVMLDETLDAKDNETSVAQINAIMDDVIQGRHGMLAKIMLWPSQRMILTMMSMQMFHDDMSESLRQITRGTDPGYFGNAMILYQRCLPEVGRISISEQETMEMARRILMASGSCDALPESLQDQLQSIFEMVRPIRSIVLRAAKIRRCIDRSTQYKALGMETVSEGPYVRGMQAAARMLLTEAAFGICQHEDGLETGKQVSGSLLGALGVAIHLADGSHLMGQLAATALLEETAELLALAVEKKAVDSEMFPELEERLRRCQGDDLLNWKKTEGMLHGTNVLETIETFGMKDRDLSRRLAKGWSQDRLFLAQFYKGGKKAWQGSPLKSPRFEFKSDRGQGALHSIEHIFDPSEEDLLLLEGPHERLLQVLNAIDRVESPQIMKWKVRSFDAYQRLETLANELKPAKSGREMKMPESKKMKPAMDGMMGH